jgi:hypothetical protein
MSQVMEDHICYRIVDSARVPESARAKGAAERYMERCKTVGPRTTAGARMHRGKTSGTYRLAITVAPSQNGQFVGLRQPSRP